ncbi:uncharacterized protein LOC119361139 isoform X3 [Triticum dicoccoides]|uniref:uncharacterized protein LOC119361139 isoform X3 n=1 Tax=Triticum dicoccoides TaxID=85692 RepID=UPI00189022EB|nr:uncharacterized protein LOC119361139 isoform X3 [Triticum dicoccoides]
MSVVYMFQFKILKKQLNFPRESSTCKDSYTKGSLYTKTSRMIRAEDLDLIVRLDVSKYDKESTERGTCMNRTEELLYAIKGLINTVTFKGSALQDSTQRNTSMGKMFPYR